MNVYKVKYLDPFIPFTYVEEKPLPLEKDLLKSTARMQALKENLDLHLNEDFEESPGVDNLYRDFLISTTSNTTIRQKVSEYM